MEFNSINEAINHVRELSEDQTTAIGDVEVWEHEGSRSVFVDVDSIVDNNEDFDGYVMIGLVSEVLY